MHESCPEPILQLHMTKVKIETLIIKASYKMALIYEYRPLTTESLPLAPRLRTKIEKYILMYLSR